MKPVEDIIDDEDEVSFTPAPSPEEARARLAALRGKPLDAPSRLAVVSELPTVEPVIPTSPYVHPDVSISLPADKMAALLKMLEGDAPKAEPQKPAKTDKPLFKPVKVRITTRVDADVLEAFKATGPGWQTLMSQHLRRIYEEGRVTTPFL